MRRMRAESGVTDCQHDDSSLVIHWRRCSLRQILPTVTRQIWLSDETSYMRGAETIGGSLYQSPPTPRIEHHYAGAFYVG